jgi:hypothetical protein
MPCLVHRELWLVDLAAGRVIAGADGVVNERQSRIKRWRLVKGRHVIGLDVGGAGAGWLQRYSDWLLLRGSQHWRPMGEQGRQTND